MDGATGYGRNEETIKPSLSIDDMDILDRAGSPGTIKRKYQVWSMGQFGMYYVCPVEMCATR